VGKVGTLKKKKSSRQVPQKVVKVWPNDASIKAGDERGGSPKARKGEKHLKYCREGKMKSTNRASIPPKGKKNQGRRTDQTYCNRWERDINLRQQIT